MSCVASRRRLSSYGGRVSPDEVGPTGRVFRTSEGEISGLAQQDNQPAAGGHAELAQDRTDLSLHGKF